MKKLLKPLAWTLVTIFFGLFQLWGVLIWSYFDKNKPFSSIDIVRDCGILFFCTSIMSALALDFFINNKAVKNISVIGVVYLIPPLLCLVFSILIYSICYYGTPEVSLITTFQYIVFGFCAIYMTVVKYLSFNKILK
jgi:hypothetical protein